MRATAHNDTPNNAGAAALDIDDVIHPTEATDDDASMHSATNNLFGAATATTATTATS